MPKQGGKEEKKNNSKWHTLVAAAHSDVHMQESEYQRRRKKGEKGMERTKGLMK